MDVNLILKLKLKLKLTPLDLNQFDEMATRLGEIPEKTRELVELQRYLKTSMTDTMPILTEKIEVSPLTYLRVKIAWMENGIVLGCVALALLTY